MDLLAAIEDIEKRYFRTASDTGANSNALFIQNRYRQAAGLPQLTREDLLQKERNEYIVQIGLAVVAGDTDRMVRYTGYVNSLDASVKK